MGTTVAYFSVPGRTSSPVVKLSPCRVTDLTSTTSVTTSTTSATLTTTIQQTTNSKNTKLQLRDSLVNLVGNINIVFGHFKLYHRISQVWCKTGFNKIMASWNVLLCYVFFYFLWPMKHAKRVIKLKIQSLMFNADSPQGFRMRSKIAIVCRRNIYSSVQLTI